MPQQIVYTDEKEDKKVMKYADKWNISKAETIKRMIIEFKEEAAQ
jgi:hypothetical protein